MKKANKQIEPRNKRQKEFLHSVVEKDVTFAIGSAGSGKTFLAAAKAIEYLEFGFVSRIIVTRPAIATEELGFLPGDMNEKLDPYLQPLFDSFTDVTNPKRLNDLLQTGEIHIAPLAFMRGRTFSNSFIILDEAQNTTVSQMKMFLTRFGDNVKVVITGDLSQSDINGLNGLQWAVDKLKCCPSVHIVKYSNSDVVRSSLVRTILKYIDDGDSMSNDSQSNENTKQILLQAS